MKATDISLNMINTIIPNIQETEINNITLYLCKNTAVEYDKFSIDYIKIEQCIGQLEDINSVIHIEMLGIDLNIDQYMIDYVNGINYYKTPYIDIETKKHIIKLDFIGIFDFNLNKILQNEFI